MPDHAVGQTLSIGCRPGPFGITPAAVGGSSDVLSRRTAARETYENDCDSFCDRREANRADWVLIDISARTDLLAFWHLFGRQ